MRGRSFRVWAATAGLPIKRLVPCPLPQRSHDVSISPPAKELKTGTLTTLLVAAGSQGASSLRNRLQAAGDIPSFLSVAEDMLGSALKGT